MNRSKQLKAALTGFVLLATALPATGAERPNIIFVMGDDHTSRAWGCYG